MPPSSSAAKKHSNTDFVEYRRWRVLAVTWVCYAAYSMGRRPFTVVRSVITKDTGLSIQGSGAVDTAFLAMYTIGQLMYHTVQSKTQLSAASLLAIGLMGSSLAVAMQSMTSSLIGFTLAGALNGALQAVGWSSCMVVVTPWLGTAERGIIMGVWGTTMAAGGILGNVITPLASDLTGGWRGGVAVVAIAMLCASIFTKAAVARHPNASGFLSPSQIERGVTSLEALGDSENARWTIEGELTTDVAKGATAKSGASLWELLSISGVASLCASYFFAKLVRYVLMFWLPFYFTEGLHIPAATSGLLASALDVGGVFGTVASGVFTDKYFGGQRRTEACLWLTTGLIASLTGFAFGTTVLATNTLLTIVGAFLCGAFSYGIDAVMSTTLLQDFADRRGVSHQLGAISGLVGGIGALGSVLQGPFTVFLAGMSWRSLFVVLQVVSFVGMLCLHEPWRLERRHRTGADSAA